jgi:hypothetical protein
MVPLIGKPAMTTPVPMKLTLWTTCNFVNKTRTLVSNLPDIRKKATANHRKYAISDATLSAFSVFFTPSPSWLDYQRRMPKLWGTNHAQSLGC